MFAWLGVGRGAALRGWRGPSRLVWAFGVSSGVISFVVTSEVQLYVCVFLLRRRMYMTWLCCASTKAFHVTHLLVV